GALVLSFSLKKLKNLSLMPNKSMQEAEQFAAGITGKVPGHHARPSLPRLERSSDEAQADLERTRHAMGQTAFEVRERLRMRSLANSALSELKAHPVPVVLGVTAAGFLSYWIFR